MCSWTDLHELRFVVIAVLQVEFVQPVHQRFAFGRQFTGQFRTVQRRDASILVATVFARQVSDRLFRSEHKLVGSVFVDGGGDVFKADQQIAEDADTVGLTDGRQHRCGDERLDEIMIGRQGAVGGPLAQDKIGQQGSQLVPRQTDEVIPGCPDRHRQPVSVRVRSHHQRMSVLLRELDGRLQGLRPLGIGQVIGNIGKTAILRSLWLIKFNLRETRLQQ